MQEETWREVPGYEGMYKIEKGTWRCYSLKTDRFLTDKPDSRGRLMWCLRINGKPIVRQAACWIAWTFPELVEGEYFEGAHIDHINTDKLDNRPENLRWGTQKENNNNPLTRKHNSEAQKGKPGSFKGKHHTEETKRKISEAIKGKKKGDRIGSLPNRW